MYQALAASVRGRAAIKLRGGDMKLDENLRFEIKAEAFRIMTGHMAPGKDASMHSYPAPYELRASLFAQWIGHHGKCLDAVIRAVERIIPDNDD